MPLLYPLTLDIDQHLLLLDSPCYHCASSCTPALSAIMHSSMSAPLLHSSALLQKLRPDGVSAVPAVCAALMLGKPQSFTNPLQAAKNFKMVPGYETDYTPTQIGENAQQVLPESRARYQSK